MLSAIAVLVAYGTMLTELRSFPLLTEILTHYSKLIFTISAPPEIRISRKPDLSGGKRESNIIVCVVRRKVLRCSSH